MGLGAGEDAERHVEEMLRAALPAGARLHANVRFVGRTRDGGPAHDGEADIVIVDPEAGLLVIEVKAGEPRRDASGRWYLGSRQLPRSPFAQAEAAKHDLVRAIRDLPDWPPDLEPRSGHAVAFPGAELASLERAAGGLGPDAPAALVLDGDALASPDAARAALVRVAAFWVGDGTRGGRLAEPELDLVDAFLAPTRELRRLVRHDLETDRERLVQASTSQLFVLNQNRSRRRADVVGPAGSGKSLLAVERARRLAREGYRTLFVCFNQPLATAVLREVEADDGRPDLRPAVTTFHRLCETMGERAGVLPPRPEPPPPEWWNETLPGALERAIDALPDQRYHAIVVDEGQDFELGWLEILPFLLFEPADGVFWVFHDPGQALQHDDHVAELGLGDPLELFEDYRSPAPVAGLANRFYRGPTAPMTVATAGRAPRIVEAEPGRPTVEAVRRELHHLIGDEGVRPWQIVVLSGTSSSKSEVWRQRRFGNVELWNGAIDDDGSSRKLPADQVPDEPADDGVVLFETIRRFKGLERPVVLLCELPAEGQRLDQLLYTALTRVTTHLVLVVPPELASRFGTMGGG